MKRYLTLIFSILAVIAVIVSYQFDVRWNGIVAWGLAFILMACATFCVQYIGEKDGDKAS